MEFEDRKKVSEEEYLKMIEKKQEHFLVPLPALEPLYQMEQLG